MKRFLLLLCLLGGVLPAFAPAQARLDLYNRHKHYKDEGKTVVDPTSRCTGTAFQQTNAAAGAQAKKDLEVAQAKATDAAAVQAAYDAYTAALGTSWSAMQQPYCGFGAFGTTAALKSFRKSIADARKKFLDTTHVQVAVTPVKIAPVETSAAPKVSSIPVVKKVVSVPMAATIEGVAFGARSAQVTALQEVLSKSGFLASSYVTGYFGPMTRDAVIALQLKKGIIDSKDGAGAGLIGPKTRAALANL